MATPADVRRIVLALPETTEDPDGDGRFFVDGKQIAWPWLERIDPKRARVPNPDVIGVRVASESERKRLHSPTGEQIAEMLSFEPSRRQQRARLV